MTKHANINIFLQKKGFWLIATTALVLLSSSGLAQVSQPQRDALALLGSAATEQTPKQLQRALAQLDNEERSVQLVLGNYLRLRLAAMDIAGQRYRAGRQTLREIEQDSPAAVAASLQYADSYRLEKQPEKALQWYLITAEHYPYRPDSLAGLLAAAGTMKQQQQPGVALALYRKIVEQANVALAQVAALQADANLEPVLLLLPSAQLDEQVRKTLLQLTLKNADHDLLQHSSGLQQAIRTVLDSQQKQAQLHDELQPLLAQLHDYQQQSKQISQLQVQNKQQQASLLGKIEAGVFDEQQINYRQQLSRLRNQQQRLQRDQLLIDNVSTQLPDIIARIENQLIEMERYASAQLADHHQILQSLISGTLQQYQRTVRDFAGEAQLNYSELLRDNL